MKPLCSNKILGYWIQVLPEEEELGFYFTEPNGSRTKIVDKTYGGVWEKFKQLAFEEFESKYVAQIIEEDKKDGKIYFINTDWPSHERSWTTCNRVKLVPVDEIK